MKKLFIYISTLLLISACSKAVPNKTIYDFSYGDRWPFSVDKGVIKCFPDLGNGAVVFEANGTMYALNGTAKSFGYKHNFKNVEPIWLDDPAMVEFYEAEAKRRNETFNQIKIALGPVNKISISEVLNEGIRLCKAK